MAITSSNHCARNASWHIPRSIPDRREKPPAVNKTTHIANSGAARRKLRVGFVPLTDCAPLVMARELGLFLKYGIDVELSRELGWATVRDKILHGELHAAHAVAGLPAAATLGLGCIACDCLTALVLNLAGNAITLSNDLWKRGVRDGATLREEIRQSRRERTLTFGIVYPYSSHHFLLRAWLAGAGIDPERDVRIVVVPPPQMEANLRAGNLDGFCAGEPWNSVAVQSRAGWCAAVSAELAPGHPEKVLLVRRDFAEKRRAEHLALVAALLEACEWCDAPDHRETLLATLARPWCVDVPAAALRRGLGSEFDFGQGRIRQVHNFTLFHRHNANEPTRDKAAWVLNGLRALPAAKGPRPGPALAGQVFRPDLFEQAVALRNSTQRKTTHELHSHPQPVPA
jgi:ABC-type nitrate/sulfonate/bicarbonate transport system substrate-binding protein